MTIRDNPSFKDLGTSITPILGSMQIQMNCVCVQRVKSGSVCVNRWQG